MKNTSNNIVTPIQRALQDMASEDGGSGTDIGVAHVRRGSVLTALRENIRS